MPGVHEDCGRFMGIVVNGGGRRRRRGIVGDGRVKSEMNPYNISITIITHITHNNNNSKYIQVSKSSAAPRIQSFQHSILAHIPVRIPDISPFLHSRASDHSQYTAHTTTAVKPAAPIITSIRSGQHRG